MEQDVFVDILFIINFSMDYLCLYICAKILHRRIKATKMLIAATIGGLYSVLSLFINASPPIAILTDVIICTLICSICFGERNRAIRSVSIGSFLFFGVSMMTGGCMTAIFNQLNRLELPLDDIDGDSISTYLFAIVAAIAGIICLRHGSLISRRSSITECAVTLQICNQSISFSALTDTGNLVKDPLSGKTVILVDRKKLYSYIDPAPIESFCTGEVTASSIKGLRLIPINTAGGKSILTAFSPDTLTLTIADKRGGTRQFSPDSLIAPTDIENSADGYDAIVPIEIIKP